MRKRILAYLLVITLGFCVVSEMAVAAYGGSGAYGEVRNFLKRVNTNIIFSANNVYEICSSSKAAKKIWTYLLDLKEGNITNVGDIALDSISSDDGTGVKIKQLKTLVDNDGIVLITDDAGQTTTVDSGSTQSVALPSVAAGDIGIWFRVVKLGAGQVTISAADSDTVADSGAGGTIYCSISTEDYASMTLQLASTTEWIIVGAHGTWVTTN